MIGETEVTDPSCFFLFYQPVENAVIHKTVVEGFFSILTTTYTVQEQIIDIVHLQVFQRILKHLDTRGT